MDNKPLADASVSFIFTEYPRPAGGRTDSSGKYTLTYANRVGAPIGACKVAIRKQGKVAGSEAVGELVPGRYNSNSQFQFEITKQGPNEFNLDLKSTPDPSDGPKGAQPAPTYEEPADDSVDGEEAPKARQQPQGNPPKKNNSDDDGDGE